MDRDVDAAVTASIFRYGEHNIGEAKSMMRAAGIRVR
jgi:imidazole glycerol phosphate synthase subunit HisF